MALNVDLCFVPLVHRPQEWLPAVSGSSGRLVVPPAARAASSVPWWPGQVFAEAELTYEEAMGYYAALTRDRLVHAKTERCLEVQAPSPYRLAMQQRAERRQVLERRKQEDSAWRVAKAAYRQARQAYREQSRCARRQQQAAWQATQTAWEQRRTQRRETRLARQVENQAWHGRNQQRLSPTPPAAEPRRWLAVLVVSDNCTRQCLGLPVFPTGAKLTSPELVAALRPLLPAELRFCISDQGAHFRTKAFAQLAGEHDFLQVPVYRHRPQSNGIAERLVRTLKDWLKAGSWQTAQELAQLLAAFEVEYNDRPHQGLPISGLSPNEFANRIWLM